MSVRRSGDTCAVRVTAVRYDSAQRAHRVFATFMLSGTDPDLLTYGCGESGDHMAIRLRKMLAG